MASIAWALFVSYSKTKVGNACSVRIFSQKYLKLPMLTQICYIWLINAGAQFDPWRETLFLRPAAWGLVLTVLGGFFWVLFSVVYGFGSALGGRDPGAFGWGLIYLTGLTMLFGIPAGIIGEIVRWHRAKKASKPPQQAVAAGGYCSQCGKQVPPGLSFCGYCGSKL